MFTKASRNDYQSSHSKDSCISFYPKPNFACSHPEGYWEEQSYSRRSWDQYQGEVMQELDDDDDDDGDKDDSD